MENASELNTMLQIIGGTTDQLENIWGGRAESRKYLAMLRASVDRAAKVTAEMVERAGGATQNVVSTTEASGVTPGPVQHRASGKHRIMVVDDEPVMRTLCETLLTKEGYEVVAAESGCQALDIFTHDRNACDLVVLDFTMPFMTGEETFRRLRDISSDLRVIVATGFIHQHVLDRMLAAGLTGFISKPMPADELLCFVAAALGDGDLNPAPSAFRGIAVAS